MSLMITYPFAVVYRHFGSSAVFLRRCKDYCQLIMNNEGQFMEGSLETRQ